MSPFERKELCTLAVADYAVREKWPVCTGLDFLPRYSRGH
jgi:hypothetical protein